MQIQRKELNFTGENIYIGIDVHLKSWSVSVLTENSHYKTFSQPSEAKILHHYLESHFPGASYYSVYEAGFCGFWVHYELQKLGINNIVVNPGDVPTTHKEKRRKTDSIDSKKLARSLRSKELEAIYVPSEDNLQPRSLIRVREALIRDLTRCKQRVKSLLHFYGIKIPVAFEKSTHVSKRYLLWLKEIAQSGRVNQQAFSISIEEMEQTKALLLKATREITLLSQSEKYAKNMDFIRSVPGIGLITGMKYLVEIENISRFGNIDKFAGFIGIVPDCHSTSEKENNGEMTRRGQQGMRSLLIESAWIAIRIDPVLTLSFNKYCKRMTPHKAIVRIARKLANRIYFVLTKQTLYVSKVV